MARTFLNRWTLLPVTLTVMIVKVGGDGSDVISYRSGARGERFWCCPGCQRVERSRMRNPRCRGTEDNRHPPENTYLITQNKSVVPSSGDPVFYC
jgi:hypothetical protein